MPRIISQDLEYIRRPVGTVVVDEDTTKTLKIPRDLAIRAIIARVVISHTTPAGAPVYVEDPLFKFIKKIRLLMNGHDKKFDLPLRMINYVDKKEKGTAPPLTDFSTAVSTTVDATNLVRFDFAADRLDRNDIDSIIPVKRLSSLNLEVDYAKIGDVATSNAPTIVDADSKVEIEIITVEGTVIVEDDNGAKHTIDINSEEANDIKLLQFQNILEGVKDIALPTAAKTSYDDSSLAEDMTPAPSTIMTNALMVTNNKVLDDALVTDIKLQRESPHQELVYQSAWEISKEEGKQEYQEESQTTGFVLLDWVDILDGGFIHSGKETDAKFRFLTAAATADQDFIQIFTRSVSLSKPTM